MAVTTYPAGTVSWRVEAAISTKRKQRQRAPCPETRSIWEGGGGAVGEEVGGGVVEGGGVNVLLRYSHTFFLLSSDPTLVRFDPE